MHELSIMGEVVRVVRRTMEANNVSKVDAVVLEVGELSGVVPRFLQDCFAAACYKTPLEGSRLEVEMVAGLGRCRDCGKVFNVLEREGKCPVCASGGYDVVSGRDFVIKQVLAC